MAAMTPGTTPVTVDPVGATRSMVWRSWFMASDPRIPAAEQEEQYLALLRELKNVFTKHGITVITPAIGEKFDPQRHEAMFEAPVPGTIAGNIIQVMDNGFMLHDRLLRPAKVGVSSMPAS